MKSPNSGGTRVPTGHHLSPNEAFNTRNGLYIIELLPKRSWENHKQYKLLPRLVGCFSQMGSKFPLSKTIPTQLIESVEVVLVPL